MNNNILRYGLVGAFMGAAIVWIFISTGGYLGIGRVMNTQIDAHFIEQMIPHHEDAITMAQIALDKAKRPEIKQLAQSIISSQGEEILQMKDWYKLWYGRELPVGDQAMQHHGMMSGSGMHMGMMGDDTDIERLTQATDFDRVFIEDMIPHHQMAVMMASMLKSGTARPEMKKLADDIITAQTEEINQMRQWYDAWL